MAAIWKILLGLVAVASLLASQASAGGDREAAVGFPVISGCSGTVGECLEDEDEEFAWINFEQPNGYGQAGQADRGKQTLGTKVFPIKGVKIQP
ncbi:Unknown protein [Striga hermonthica]|uniref:Uncharacterized protein n=1 Tax=Striga hermonthica TaxID=68872 RepID=A0A9N7REA5_STRHE|nr:Unknown protein [Striga hermonthica]